MITFIMNAKLPTQTLFNFMSSIIKDFNKKENRRIHEKFGKYREVVKNSEPNEIQKERRIRKC